MTVGNLLKKCVFRVGGVIVYYAAKASARIVNCNKKYFKIHLETKNKLGILFPSMDLSKVRII